MSDDSLRKHAGPRHEGPGHSAPYPLSRMAPPHDLVDAAAEIQKADATLATMTGGKLQVIVDQIRSLQEHARAILEQAQRDAELHRAKCNFQKRPGRVYHLYRRDSGEVYFSMMAPDEWSLPQAQTFLGSYRLEADMSWTPEEALDRRNEDAALLSRLLGAAPGRK